MTSMHSISFINLCAHNTAIIISILIKQFLMSIDLGMVQGVGLPKQKKPKSNFSLFFRAQKI
jgi:hypothetical protein